MLKLQYINILCMKKSKRTKSYKSRVVCKYRWVQYYKLYSTVHIFVCTRTRILISEYKIYTPSDVVQSIQYTRIYCKWNRNFIYSTRIYSRLNVRVLTGDRVHQQAQAGHSAKTDQPLDPRQWSPELQLSIKSKINNVFPVNCK